MKEAEDLEKVVEASSKDKVKLIRPFGDTEGIPIDFRKIMRGWLQHLTLVVVCSVIGAAFFLYLYYAFFNLHVAEGIIVYRPNTPKELPGGYPLYRMTLSSAVEMITVPKSLNALKSTLGLDLTTAQLTDMITVTPPAKESFLIKIDAKAKSPTLAVDIVNALSNIVVNQSSEMYRRQLLLAYNYFKTEAEADRQKQGDLVKKIAEFQRTNEIFGGTIEGSAPLRKLLMAETELQRATSEYNRLFVEYENYRREVEKLPTSMVSGAAALEAQLSSMELALASAKSLYADTNPKVKTLEAQIAALRKQLEGGGETEGKPKGPVVLGESLRLTLIGMEAKLRSAQKAKEEAATSLASLRKEMADVPQEVTELAHLMSEKEYIDAKIKAHEEMMSSAQLLSNVKGGDLDLYQEAELVDEDHFVQRLLPLFGLILGCGFGVFLSLIIEFRDPRIRTAKQVELYYTPPCLMMIPKFTAMTKQQVSERLLFYVRIISERIHLATDSRFHTICVTSAVDGEGKSLLSYDLAIYLASVGKKTIILDFDYKENAFQSQEPPKHYLEDYLRGQVPLAEVIMKGKPDRISVGHHIADMNELVHSSTMNVLWSELKERYDLIIYETPGIVKEDYALVLTKGADVSLFMINSSKTEKMYVDEALKQLEVAGIRPTGIILNRVLPVYTDDIRMAEESRRHEKGFLTKFWG